MDVGVHIAVGVWPCNRGVGVPRLEPTILGMNPTQIDKVFAAIKSYGDPFSNSNKMLTPRNTGAMSAIECACWDISGKVYGVPVWKLLGPKLRDRVQMYCDTHQQISTSALQTHHPGMHLHSIRAPSIPRPVSTR